jgi:hypothetical protein
MTFIKIIKHPIEKNNIPLSIGSGANKFVNICATAVNKPAATYNNNYIKPTT